MVEVAIVSDTHVPSRAEEIPDWVRDRIEAADFVVHAGDFDSPDAYEEVESLANELIAVDGNMDPPALGLPAVKEVVITGVRIVVTHGSGPIDTYEERVLETFLEHDADIGVSGHTHELVDERVEGVRWLNPGSATAASPATDETMYTLELDAEDFELDTEKNPTPEDLDIDVTLHEG